MTRPESAFPVESNPAHSATVAMKAAVWIGILTTLATCALGWLIALAWVLSHGGLGRLVAATDVVLLVAAISFFCALVATMSAVVALRWAWRERGTALVSARVSLAQPTPLEEARTEPVIVRAAALRRATSVPRAVTEDRMRN